MKKILYIFTTRQSVEKIENSFIDSDEYQADVFLKKEWEEDYVLFVSRRAKEIKNNKYIIGAVGLTPTSAVIAALVNEAAGSRGAHVTSVLNAQNKFASRKIQLQAAPESVPYFALLNKQVQKEKCCPGFVKPVHASTSFLANVVRTKAQLAEVVNVASRVLPKKNAFYTRLFMDGHRAQHQNNDQSAALLLESILPKVEQITVDGYVFNGAVSCIGATLSKFIPGTLSFDYFLYPRRYQPKMKNKIYRIVKKVIKAHGLDNTFFNIELRVNPRTYEVFIVEINPRISKQFVYMFKHVGGLNVYHAMAKIADGVDPRFRESRTKNRIAVNFVMRRKRDAVVVSSPKRNDILAIQKEFELSKITILAKKGKRLSEMNQDSFTYRYGFVDVVAKDVAEAKKVYAKIVRKLDIRFE